MRNYLLSIIILLGACTQKKLNVKSISQSGKPNTSAVATPSPNLSTLQIDKSNYDFGVALIGQNYTATFTLSNSGSTEVSSISGTGLSSELSFLGGSFPGTNGTCSTSLSAGASCTIILSLVPTTSGSLSQTLSLSYSDGSSTASSVTLTLTATKISASPASIFERTGTPQSRQAFERYGAMTATDGTNLAVLALGGTCGNNGANCNTKGEVYIYSKSGSAWVLDKEIVPYSYLECSGLSSMDLDNGRLAVGCLGDSFKDTTATYNASGAGSVKTYKKNGSNWDFEKKIYYDGPGAANSYFGQTLSLSGNTLAVGAKNHTLDENDANTLSNAGAVFVYTYSTTWTFQQKLVSTVRETNEYFGFDISLDGDTLVVGSPYHKTDASGANPLTNAGAAFVFVRSGTTWSLQQKIVPTGTNARNLSDSFGISVSLDQDTLAVGASGHSYDSSGANSVSSSGAVFIYDRSGSTWSQSQKVIATTRHTGSGLGRVVELKGTDLVVSAPYEYLDSSETNSVNTAGAIYVFTKSGGTFSQQAKITPTGTNARLQSDNLGLCSQGSEQGIAVIADEIFVGACNNGYDDNGANLVQSNGTMFGFSRSGSTWSQSGRYTEPVYSGDNVVQPGDYYATEIVGDENQLIVSAPGRAFDANGANPVLSRGAVYVYNRTGFSLTLSQVLYAPNTVPIITDFTQASGAGFGTKLALSGDNLAISIPYDELDESGANTLWWAGSVAVYHRNAGTWTFEQKLISDNRAAFEMFGSSIAASGDTLAVGATGTATDQNGANSVSNAGAVFVYVKSGSTWSLQQKLVPSGTNARNSNDSFGSGVSLYQDTLVVGAPSNKFDENGANSLNYAGAAFVFERSGTTWSQLQKVVPSARAANQQFGRYLLSTANFFAVGVPSYGYDAQSNVLANQGATFIYEKSGGTYSEATTLKPQQASTGGAFFGTRLAFDGTTLAVSAPRDELDGNGQNAIGYAGAIYFYQKSGSTWTFKKKWTAVDNLQRNWLGQFGNSGLFMLGNEIFVGIPAIYQLRSNGNSLPFGGILMQSSENLW